ncbi:MAG: DNA-binding transcriptional MocR family regulator [Akkermansiaceae bacterium]|jgi:DNA-binding transcriptional MocR family regulator
MDFEFSSIPQKGKLRSMPPAPFVLQSASLQVASYLRDCVERRVFVTEVPGIHPLAAQLNVNHKTVTKALRLLEVEGVLASQGPGRRRRIINSKSTEDQSLRVGILCLEAPDPGLDPLIDTAEGGTIGRVPKSSV